ncbi:MAG TPA: serine hydrolase domain-containing protein [Bacteroidales bacterium]|nr:serine hydrolase domain-containing protein [Bacteroidales bacterium]
MKTIVSLLFVTSFAYTLAGQNVTDSRYIDSLSKANNFNGTILVQSQNKVSYHKAFGYANLEFKVAGNTETKYWIASITKLFTSVLVMQLYENGRIDLNKTIGTYLPAYKGEGRDKVTIHQLLNHTSGIGNMDKITSIEQALQNGLPAYQKPMSISAMLNQFCSDSLVNEPGKVFDYNNADFIILGNIIEKLYNKSYEEVLNEKIIQPLQMKNTGLLHQQDIAEGLANTYFYRDDIKKLVPDLPVYHDNWYSAGSMYSTTTDLLKFANALFGLKLLKQETLDKMFVSGAGEYGYGTWVYEDYKINNKMFKIIKRPGGIMGAQTVLFHIYGTGSTIIVLSNTANLDMDHFVAQIAKHIGL